MNTEQMNHTTIEELTQSSGQVEHFRSVVSSSQFMDVHLFDYSYKDQQHSPVDMNHDEKRQWIQRLMDIMKNPASIQGTNLILANIGHPANQDTTNHKSAEDILVLLAKHVLEKDRDFLPLIEEQMQDMLQLGQCAQGRTTRLWQLYQALH